MDHEHAYGFDVVALGAAAGEAAAAKMLPPSFMKPLEALAIELLCSSAQMDPGGIAWASIDQSIGTNLYAAGKHLLEAAWRLPPPQRPSIASP